jgi:ubiquitin carboxyl-terminal hydrolase 5/13
VRPRVPFQACLQAWAAPEQINDFYSTAIRGRTIAIKYPLAPPPFFFPYMQALLTRLTYTRRNTKLASFPEVLIVQMRKFFLDGWTPKKLGSSLPPSPRPSFSGLLTFLFSDVLLDVPDEIDLYSYRGTGKKPEERELPPEQAPAASAPARPAPDEVRRSPPASAHDALPEVIRSLRAAGDRGPDRGDGFPAQQSREGSRTHQQRER